MTRTGMVFIPLGIIVTEELIFTVCLEDTPVLRAFMDGRVRNFFTYKRTRFILEIPYKNASMFLHYLRQIDKKSEMVEKNLHKSQRNQELIELLELENPLIFHHIPPIQRSGAGETFKGGQHQKISGGYRTSGRCYY